MTEGKKTIQTIVMVIALTILAKCGGFVRNMLISSNFGAGLESDTYFMALKITSTVFMTIGSAITTTMIPIIVGYLKKEDKKKAFEFANKIFTILFSIGLFIVSMGMMGASYYTKWIVKGFSGEKLSLTIKLTQTMFPILICIMISYICVSLLQSFGKFSITSVLSVPYNIILITYLVFFAARFGVQGLAIATLIGWVSQFMIQLPYLYKKGYRVKLILDFKDPDVRTFFKLILPIFLSTMVYSVNNIIDARLASTLSEGKVSALDYAFGVYTAIATMTIYGISTVLFPKFAKHTSTDDYDAFKRQIVSTIKVLCFLLIPITVGLATLSKPIVRLAFERGAFNEQGVFFTKIALTYYTIGMIGFGIQEVLNKAFFALKDTKTPMKFGIVSVTINIVLNIILIKVMDLAGLALATSLATITNAILLYISLMKKIGNLDTKNILITLSKVLISSGIMAVATFKMYQYLVVCIGMSSFVLKGITVGGSIFVGIITYALVVVLLKVEEAKYIIDHFIRRSNS